MTKRKTTLQINGSHYDALTGAMLEFEATPVKGHPAIKSIDGVIGGPAKHPMQSNIRPIAVTSKPAVRAAMPAPTSAKPKATKPAITRQVAAHAAVHKAKPSATLMRHAVQKPTAASLKRHTKVQAAHHAASQVTLASHLTVPAKYSLHAVNQQRAQRATAVSTSPRIGKFAHEVTLSLSRELEQVAVAADKAFVIPQNPQPLHITVSPKSSDVFEQALLRATSHEQPQFEPVTAKGRKAARLLRRRMVGFTAAAVMVLAVVGFFGYNNQGFQFRKATSGAGFSASLPGYQPSGFSIASVKTTNGYVNLRYTNPLTGRDFLVAEKPSDWNSELLSSKLAASPTSSVYNTMQRDGRTIYVYGQNQAAWVHKGVLYQVLGNGSLASSDFAAIAASI